MTRRLVFVILLTAAAAGTAVIVVLGCGLAGDRPMKLDAPAEPVATPHTSQDF